MTATLTEDNPLGISTPAAPSLRDMLEDGIYLLFLLKDGTPPEQDGEFKRLLEYFLRQFEASARNFGKDSEAVRLSRFAYCALIDEIILSSKFKLRDEWERTPLQMSQFGEHLAGENFFDNLDKLRLDPVKNLEALEVFYTCLLLGFQGKYLLEGQEKLDYLVQKLGQEIQQARGGKADFAPNWRLPQRFQAYIRHELPIWIYIAFLFVVGAGIFITYRLLLSHELGQLMG
jgi:type VI secretion system protein ImpK